MKKASPIEDFIFDFLDKCKLLFFPEKWNSTFLDYSTLLFVYRKGVTNMSEISRYLGIPLIPCRVSLEVKKFKRLSMRTGC